jgi:hypothetical protein
LDHPPYFQLIEEKRKTDALLNEMLPAPVADQLKQVLIEWHVILSEVILSVVILYSVILSRVMLSKVI